MKMGYGYSEFKKWRGSQNLDEGIKVLGRHTPYQVRLIVKVSVKDRINVESKPC